MDLLAELLSTLTDLPVLVPADLIRVHLDHSRRHGCVLCRFRTEGAHVDVCGCQRHLEEEGPEGLGTARLWMAMTLVVRPVDAEHDGLVFIGVGVDPEPVACGAKRKAFIEMVSGTEGVVREVQEWWPKGVVRASLISMIYEEAIACGCWTVTHDGLGRYSRAATAELLADCNTDRIFDIKSPANPGGSG